MAGRGQNRGGRPSKLTPQVLRKLEEAFAWGATDRETCLYAAISPSTLYRFQRENREFLDRKRQFQLRPILKARVAVVAGILRDPYLALKFLEKKLPAEFGRGGLEPTACS